MRYAARVDGKIRSLDVFCEPSIGGALHGKQEREKFSFSATVTFSKNIIGTSRSKRRDEMEVKAT